jgi:hypothetical protein
VSGVCTATSYVATSDYRSKTNVVPLSENKSVDQLQPVEYDLVEGSHDMGFLAHEVQKVFPFLVTGNKDDETRLQRLNYNGLIALLVKEIKDLKQKQMETNEIGTIVGNSIASDIPITTALSNSFVNISLTKGVWLLNSHITANTIHGNQGIQTNLIENANTIMNAYSAVQPYSSQTIRMNMCIKNTENKEYSIKANTILPEGATITSGSLTALRIR